MSETTGVEWATSTWNPWYGCRKVSPACAHCYAERDMSRYGRDFSTVTRAKDATFFAPIMKWKEPKRIFTCSWSDFFIEDADPWRLAAWNVICGTLNRHTYLILTKRTERLAEHGWKEWPENVWIGASVENSRFYGRIRDLQETKAKVRFLSVEPMLEAMADIPLDGIQWVIIGSESGSEPRPTRLNWIRELRDICLDRGVAVFVKQLTTTGGIKIPYESWPADLQIRQFPRQVNERKETSEQARNGPQIPQNNP